MTISMPTIPDGRADDLHGPEDAIGSDLNLFMAGNQFMVMPELLEAFKEVCPQVHTVYYQTLPPGLQLKQVLAGGALFRGKTLQAMADVYTGVSREGIKALERAGKIDTGGYRVYLHNRLALMLPAGNRAGIRSIQDLGRGDVRISQPDPANEDIAGYITDMYREAGGDRLVARIMEEKRAEGTTIMTRVHHRETPLRIRLKTVDAGPVWATEAVHAAGGGLSFERLDPGPELDQRHHIRYFACRLRAAPHPDNAERFMAFLVSVTARGIYEKYGFVAPGASLALPGDEPQAGGGVHRGSASAAPRRSQLSSVSVRGPDG